MTSSWRWRALSFSIFIASTSSLLVELAHLPAAVLTLSLTCSSSSKSSSHVR
jgi:hypothetical protein